MLSVDGGVFSLRHDADMLLCMLLRDISPELLFAMPLLRASIAAMPLMPRAASATTHTPRMSCR